jgi:hypothetical protein
MAGENRAEQGELDPKIRTAANLFLAAAALAVAVALAYFATDWDSRIGGAGSVLLYYAAPAALLLLLARSLRAPPAQRVSMALLLFGTLAPLYAAEAALQVMRSAGPSFGVRDARNSICPGRWRNRPVCAAAAAAGVPFDSRSALHVLRDLEGDGVEAWPSQAPFGDAMGARSPDAHLVREGRHLVVDGRPILPLRPGVAMHGFNNPPGLHRVGAARIALAGDSFGQGACVPAGANAAAVLRASAPATLNLGLLGAGPLAGLGIVREYAAPLRPEVVVWLFYEGNDLTDLERERAHPLLTKYLDPSFTQGLRASADEVDQALRGWISALRDAAEERERLRSGADRHRSHLIVRWGKLQELRSRVRRALEPQQPPEYPFDESFFRLVSSRFSDDVASWGGRLLFVYLPAYERFAQPPLANPHRERILETMESLGIPSLDLTPAFERDDPLGFFHFRVKSHYTEAGYRLVADEIFLRLAELGWVVGTGREKRVAIRAR